MTWPPALLLCHDHLPWMLDATRVGMPLPSEQPLPWTKTFAEMQDLEAGGLANQDEARRVGHFWLRSPERAPDIGFARTIGRANDAVVALADAIVSGRAQTDAGQAFTHVIHIGVGGSALGPQLLIDALGEGADGHKLGLPIHFLDNTDPDGVSRTLSRLGTRLATTLVVMVSKSGGTAEPRCALSRVRMAMRELGVRPNTHLVAITAEGSQLDALAIEEGWRARIHIADWVGGRFSVTSPVGLLPAELAGIDTPSLIAGARDMDDWTRIADPDVNPAAVLAASWHHAGRGKGDRHLVMMPYADRLAMLSRYLQQLVMESLGKRHDRHGEVVLQGLTVFGNRGSTDQHAFVQQLRDGRRDALVTFFQVLGTDADDPKIDGGPSAGDQLQGFLMGTRRALDDDGRPTLTITVPKVDAYTMGGIIALFERAVGLYASLIDLNAYHQPGVEAGKLAGRAILRLGTTLLERLQQGSATVPELADALSADPRDIHDLLLRLRHKGSVAVQGSTVSGTWSLS